MIRILIFIAALISAPAFADVSAFAGSLSGAAAQSGSLSAANQGNAQNLTINGAPIPDVTTQNVNHTGTSTVKTVPMVYAPPMGVTAPCRVALSAGVSVIGVGVAAGGSVPDAPCNLRELSRTYQALGATEKAVKVADGALALECLDETTAKALGTLCSVPTPTPAPKPVAAAPAPMIVAAAPVTPACTTETSASGIKTTTCRQ